MKVQNLVYAFFKNRLKSVHRAGSTVLIIISTVGLAIENELHGYSAFKAPPFYILRGALYAYLHWPASSSYTHFIYVAANCRRTALAESAMHGLS